MKPRLVSALTLFAVSVGAFGQEPPVTVKEADIVFNRIETAMRTVLKLPKLKAEVRQVQRPITKNEVILRLDKMFEAIKPKFQYTPRPFKTNEEVLNRYNSDPEIRKKLLRLVKYGCVAPVGPLVVGSPDTVSMADFGDALGYFMSQMAFLTYYADPKWAPNLQNSGDGA